MDVNMFALQLVFCALNSTIPPHNSKEGLSKSPDKQNSHQVLLSSQGCVCVSSALVVLVFALKLGPCHFSHTLHCQVRSNNNR